LPDYEPRPKAYADAAKMYAAEKPDAVVICTPHTLHYENGVQALEAGCHVLMEKPMVANTADAYALKAKVEQTGKILTIGYNTPCAPMIAWLREQIRTNALGKLEMVSGFISQNWMRGTTGSWRQNPKLSGGGQAYDSGAHPLSTLTWTVESPVEEVFAFVDDHGTPVDINSCMSIRFANGVIATMAISGNSPGGGSFMVFIFDGGRVEVDGWGAGWIRVYGSDGKQIENPEIAGTQIDPVTNFVDSILGKAEPRTTPNNGLVHTELMDAICESQATGKPAKPKHSGA
jgi:predicted dehydrogenase